MRSFTNLSRPDSPYQSESRPCGTYGHLLTAVAIDWSYSPHLQTAVVASVSVVHLRIRSAATLDAGQRPLSIKFHTTAVEADGETQDQIAHVDTVLAGARRHANVLAAHGLADDLAQVMKLTGHQLPGVQDAHEAWVGRDVSGHGLPWMVDTRHDVPDDERLELDVSLDPLTIIPDNRPGHVQAAVVAVRSLSRCVAIGLAAAVHTGQFRWDGTFLAQAAVADAAWDVFEMPTRPAPAT